MTSALARRDRRETDLQLWYSHLASYSVPVRLEEAKSLLCLSWKREQKKNSVGWCRIRLRFLFEYIFSWRLKGMDVALITFFNVRFIMTFWLLYYVCSSLMVVSNFLFHNSYSAIRWCIGVIIMSQFILVEDVDSFEKGCIKLMIDSIVPWIFPIDTSFLIVCNFALWSFSWMRKVHSLKFFEWERFQLQINVIQQYSAIKNKK